MSASDEQLVLEALDDSHPAFEQLIGQYQYRVLRTIASIVTNEQAAQDVAQETFLSAWNNLPKLKEKQRFGGWLNQIAINFAKRWLREQQRYQEHTASFKDMISLTQERRYQRDKLRHEVWEAIDELTEDYREAVILHYISGYSYKEISKMLSVPFSTIVGRLQEARNQLRKEFLDMVTKLQLEIDSTVHKFLKEHAKQNGVSVEGLIIRLIDRYRRDVDATGAIARQIRDNVQDFFGAISPNGRYLSHGNWDKGNLAIHDFETGKSRDVTHEGTWGKGMQYTDLSIWSPDSKQIAYLWISSKDLSLRVVGIDGSKPRVLHSSPIESGYLFPREWSRDGMHILAIHYKKEDETHDFVLVSVSDGSIHVLKTLDGCSLDHQMSLSPDGRYVVYDSPQNEDSPNRDISLLATDGSHEMVLVKHPANDFAPFWAPDGDRIVFASDRSGSMGIWVLEVIDGEPRGYPQLINHNLNGMVPLGLTQDGSYYYGIAGGENDIYFADLNPETGEAMTPPAKAIQSFEGFNYAPAFSPDGKRLAYASLRPRGTNINFRAIVVRSLETGEERELSPEIRVISHYCCWSPDGRSILTCAAKEREGIYQIDAETGAAIPVVLNDVQGSISPVSPVWSPDGSKIFFKRHLGGIKVYDFETKREWKPDFHLACGEGHPYGLALSPDGQQLAFMISCDNEWSLQIAPSSGGDTRETARLRKEETHQGWGLTWTPDDRYLLFLGKPKDEANGLCELWQIPVEGGNPQNLGLMIKWHLGVHLSFHPDGRRIAFTGPGPRPGREVWAMENFLPEFTADK
ncbi:sigma-70 family RNA polymerase sigma factor [Candidatus Poribacteria bacterium]